MLLHTTQVFLFFCSVHAAVVTDVIKSPELTPDGANRRSTRSRAAVATQTAVCQPISGLNTFFALRVTIEQQQQQRFQEMSSVINHVSLLTPVRPHLCEIHVDSSIFYTN